MGRHAVKSFEKPTNKKCKGKNDIIPKIDSKRGHNKVTDKENLMVLAKKLVINHPELSIEQAYDIEKRRQAARQKRDNEPTIDASIHSRIDELMEQYMMEGTEDNGDKENLIAPEEDPHARISFKLDQMEINDWEGPRDGNNTISQ